MEKVLIPVPTAPAEQAIVVGVLKRLAERETTLAEAAEVVREVREADGGDPHRLCDVQGVALARLDALLAGFRRGRCPEEGCLLLRHTGQHRWDKTDPEAAARRRLAIAAERRRSASAARRAARAAGG